MAKYTKEEMQDLAIDFGKGELYEYANQYASEYDYEADTLNAEEAIRDAVVSGVIWALKHLK